MNSKVKFLIGFIIVIVLLSTVIVLNSTNLKTSQTLGSTIGWSLGYSRGDRMYQKFSFTDKGKISQQISFYNEYNSPLDTFLTKSVEIIDVPFINQVVRYPTGCESVSTTTVLQYYGIDITVDDFIDNHLKKSELKILKYTKNGNVIFEGEHPNNSFIGNPKSVTGLGCYENTIVNAINSVLEEKELQEYFTVESHRDLTLQDMQSYLDRNIPIIVWATQNMVNSVEGMSWYLVENGEIFQYMKNEHCLVAIGYDDENFYFNDSLVGRIAYPKDLFYDRYQQMNTRAVTVEYHQLEK